jgi:hypothetical protein
MCESFPEHVEAVYEAIIKGELPSEDILVKKFEPTFKGKLRVRHADFKTHLYSIESIIENSPQEVVVGYKYFNVALNVALRRGINTEKSYDSLIAVWGKYRTELLNELSLRWLVSNTDSLTDYGDSSAKRAVAMLASALANTVKLVETERRLHATENYDWDGKPLKNNWLFDQMTTFDVKAGDLMSNMWSRFDAVAALDDLAGDILKEVLKRLTKHNTIYSRLLKLRAAI